MIKYPSRIVELIKYGKTGTSIVRTLTRSLSPPDEVPVDPPPISDPISDAEYETMQYFTPWIFGVDKTSDPTVPYNLIVSSVYGSDWVLVDHETGERLSSSHGRDTLGVNKMYPDTTQLEFTLDMVELGPKRVFALYFSITGGSLFFGTIGPDTNVNLGTFEIVEWNDSAPKVRIAVCDMAVILPQAIPVTWKNISSMFSGANLANPDISMWDVSEVVNMDYMFEDAKSFNQDLSNWYVPKIPSKPYHFDTNVTRWYLPKPNWGISGVA